MTSVLIVEDEESLADPLAFLLRKEGFEATVVTDGPSALAEFDRAGADIVLLDLMLPGMSGTDVCKQLRSRSSVPVIMVTARDSEIDKVVGLELGADDYVTKPYSARELIARIRAVLRRGGDDDSEVTDGVLESGPVRMDVERHVVSVNGDTITLPLKEFDLLEYLMRNSGRVLTRGQLIEVATGLFADHGYEGTSIEAVLTAAGVSRGALYHHFAGKEALFTAVLEALSDPTATLIETGIRQ